MFWTIEETIDFIFYLPGVITDWVFSLPIWVAIILFLLYRGWIEFSEWMGWKAPKSLNEKVDILWEKHLAEAE
jgi:hypothetical protein